MDFQTYNQKPQKKLSSLAIALAVHALILGMALQANHVFPSLPKSPITVTFDDFKKPEEPKPIEIKETETLPPPSTFVIAPEIAIETVQKATPFTDITNLYPDDRGFKKTEAGEGKSNYEPVVPQPHAPLHVAASVDARACEKPAYPSSSIKLEEEGTVNLAMLIGADGHVLESKVEKSSGSRALDKAAIQGLSLCKFKPGTVDGVAEKSWTKLQYVWTLDR